MSDVLAFEKVSKSYRRGVGRQRVLIDASFAIEAGQLAAVIGDRFGGKTTLLRLAAGMEAPTEGRVRFDGTDIASMSEPDRTRLLGSGISWCDRLGPGMSLSVRDWVSMPLWVGVLRDRRQASKRANEALAWLGVGGCAEQRWPELSAWERVQVSLARGIVCKPRLLLVDDLLDGLGMLRTQEAGGLLRLIAGELDCAVLVAVSDAAAAMLADRLMSLRSGELDQMSNGEADTPGQLIVFPRRVQSPDGG